MFKDVLEIYNRNLISIIILCLILVIPVNFISMMLVIYVSASDHFSYPGLVKLCILLINFIILFPPFSLMTMNDLEDRESGLKDYFLAFIENFSFLLIFTIIIFGLSLVGAVFLFIPTLFGAAFLFLTPVFLHSNSLKDNFSKVWISLKTENIFILIDIMMLVSLQLFVWFLAALLVDQFDNNVLVYIALRVLVNTLLFPFFYIYITRKYSEVSYKTDREIA
ncbi:hypothetical protein [Bacillus methanolicus]|uniref:Uncharacterized protein n=1 Tax=Bacillus methanolicus (strain MGA3 / ATCC 53907) TaxID=796606 RepID=I3DTZ1_BACMM|nr:hypothetical protein [Bacillus methanolicus]AIE58782.1 hypothetical protein BMMGA3_01540 [Bacillus methanolicus MGA3]EIJ77712.1 hypothetical protein MGA3_16833 [Bacillus methanolicus MGA3]